MSSNNKKEKQKLTISNYVNNAKKNINNSSKLLNEESIQEIDSEDNNVNIAKINQKTTIAKSSKINNNYLRFIFFALRIAPTVSRLKLSIQLQRNTETRQIIVAIRPKI